MYASNSEIAEQYEIEKTVEIHLASNRVFRLEVLKTLGRDTVD